MMCLETFWDDEIHVTHVLTQLLQNQLYVKAEKCEFRKIVFLGYVISPG